MRRKRILNMSLGNWHCLIASPPPHSNVISLMWQKHCDYSGECPVCGQVWSSNRRPGSISLSFSLTWYLPHLLSVGFYWTHMSLLSLPLFSFIIPSLSPSLLPFCLLIYPSIHSQPTLVIPPIHPFILPSAHPFLLPIFPLIHSNHWILCPTMKREPWKGYICVLRTFKSLLLGLPCSFWAEQEHVISKRWGYQRLH